MGTDSLIQGLIGLLIITTWGCSQQSNVPMSDMAKAREVAEKVLDAWKSGAAMEGMKNETPPIVVSEDLWRNRVKLTSYKFQGDGERLGTNVRHKILLIYTDKGGKKVERTFNYLITTVPAITFFREEG